MQDLSTGPLWAVIYDVIVFSQPCYDRGRARICSTALTRELTTFANVGEEICSFWRDCSLLTVKFVWPFYWILKRKVYLATWMIYPNTMARGPQRCWAQCSCIGLRPALVDQVKKFGRVADRFQCSFSFHVLDSYIRILLTSCKNWASSERRYCRLRVNRRGLLVNFLTHSVYQYIEDCGTYEAAVAELKRVAYIKTKNHVFPRHLLATRRQPAGECLQQFLQVLKTLYKDCTFIAVSAEQ